MIEPLEQRFFLTPPDLIVLLQRQREGESQTVDLSLDLGRSRCKVRVEDGKVVVEKKKIRLPLPEIEISEVDTRTIWIFRKNGWEKWHRFDPARQKYYKMVFVAPGKPPTIEISGIKMHVTQGGDPALDTRRKLNSLGLLRGRVLETCLGLGYSAIASASRGTVKQVIACEADLNVLNFCRENPWSQELFTSPKIHLVVEPVEQFLGNIPEGYFSAVLHDPPRFALAPQLYSLEFYHRIFRILRQHGQFYHYTGNPNQAQRKHSLAQQTRARLKKAGFSRVKEAYQGVLAIK